MVNETPVVSGPSQAIGVGLDRHAGPGDKEAPCSPRSHLPGSPSSSRVAALARRLEEEHNFLWKQQTEIQNSQFCETVVCMGNMIFQREASLHKQALSPLWFTYTQSRNLRRFRAGCGASQNTVIWRGCKVILSLSQYPLLLLLLLAVLRCWSLILR